MMWAPSSYTPAAAEFVVPRSIPIRAPILCSSSHDLCSPETATGAGDSAVDDRTNAIARARLVNGLVPRRVERFAGLAIEQNAGGFEPLSSRGNRHPQCAPDVARLRLRVFGQPLEHLQDFD